MSTKFKPGDRVTTTARQCVHAARNPHLYSGDALNIPTVPLYFDEAERCYNEGMCWIRRTVEPSEDDMWLVPLSSLSLATDEPTTQPLTPADWRELAQLARSAAGVAQGREDLVKFHSLAHACELRCFALGLGKVLP